MRGRPRHLAVAQSTVSYTVVQNNEGEAGLLLADVAETQTNRTSGWRHARHCCRASLKGLYSRGQPSLSLAAPQEYV
ncbi:hypothetical protein MRX96_031540 [Rhipicephalus microplus]